MSFLAKLNLTWQSVAALAIFAALGGYLLHVLAVVSPQTIPHLALLVLGGGGLALKAPALGGGDGPKPPEAQ